jgi:dimethylglycine dehydrogenase
VESHARVVIIGGGVVGCSILFHLAKFGWKDCVLLERNELTSGSSWHAAGQIHTISSDPNISRLQGYTINLYKEIEEVSGHSVGMHNTGGFYLASNKDWYDYLKRERSKARYMGLDQEFISVEEVARRHPLIDPKRYIAALWDPLDGDIDPSGVTYAYAKAAKVHGGTYHTHTPVIETSQRADGSWDVVTEEGTIHAEHIVNAGPAGIDYEGNMYFRQEGKGMLLGTYEPVATPWSVSGTPQHFGHELLEPQLDHIAERLELGFERIPALAQAGIKDMINGPFTFGPDGNPMIGPVPGMRNYWAAVGVMAGFCQAGGVGKCLAEWMIEGEPEIDVWAMDIARFGDYASPHYGTVKSTENYERRFILTFPNETLPKGRCQRTTALYDRLTAKGAVWGDGFGLENVLWFANDPQDAYEEPTFRRSRAHDYVAEEVRAVRENVGAVEIANFAKHSFKGPDAARFLDHIMAGRLPSPGRISLSPLLTPKGKLYGDLSVACLSENEFLLLGSGAAQEMHRRWFEMHLDGYDVAYRNESSQWHGIALSGPNSRELLSRISRDDVSAEGLKFRDVHRTFVGGVPAILTRLSFSGELGFEIYVAPEYQIKLYDAIIDAGVDLGLKFYGARALMSLRLEKNWGAWTLDYRPDFTAAESGMDAFINWDKDFIGKSAALQHLQEGPQKRLVTMTVDTVDIDVCNDEAILKDGECVGYVTSGGYAHYVKKSVAMGYVPAALAVDGCKLEIEINGEMFSASVIDSPLYDPAGEKMRA